MNFKNYNDLISDVKEWTKRLPVDFDLILGVPRSGLIPAVILSLHYNIPFTTVDVFARDEYIISGGSRDSSNNKIKNILVVDDSIYLGRQMSKVKGLLKDKENKFNIKYSAVYLHEKGEDLIDYHFKTIGQPRFFEWNVMNHSILKESCLDIDGVLCEDPTIDENDDGPKYSNFLLNAKPKYIPKQKIKYLVSSRLERYRLETETWLKSQNIDYEELYLINLPDGETRRKLRPHAKFKAEIYKNSNSNLFIESSEWQAKDIAKITNKPVLCTDNMRLYQNE